MSLTTAQVLQLLGGAVAAVVCFAMIYRMPERRTLILLIILIPIQLIDSRYGTLNTFLTYIVAFAFALQGRLKAAPLFWAFFLLYFAYGVSLALSHPAARVWHVIYMIGFTTNILLFYMVYNYVLRTDDWRSLFNALFITNALVVVACLVEISLGDNQIRLFGINEWRLGSSRADQGRLVGPFGSTHTTADYLVTQCMLIGCWLVKGNVKRKRWLVALLSLNFLCLVATGDRGGFVEIVVGSVLFLFLFRKDIGGFRVVKYYAIGIAAFVLASVVVVQYTEFDRLFERLESTELEGEERPRTIGFNRGVRWFQENPIVGRGPKLNVSSRNRQIDGIPYLGAHPHNLVLTILVTTGLVGLVAWATLTTAILLPLFGAARQRDKENDLLSALPKLGILILLLFFMGEMRIEFLRTAYWDYQNYMFVLVSLLLVTAHRKLKRGREQAKEAAAESFVGFGRNVSPGPLAANRTTAQRLRG